jgi:hypothetical protein
VGQFWRAPKHFVNALRSRLQVLTGRREDRLWWDRRLRASERFDEEIRDNLENSAILVAVISPGYVHSKVCTQELETFLRRARETGSLTVDNLSRVLPVVRIPVEQEIPDYFNQLQHLRFYQGSVWERFTEFDPSSAEFRQGIAELAHHISRLLRTLRSQLMPVYVAATSDLGAQRERLQRELEMQGYRPLPEGAFPKAKDLHEARIGVFLIGQGSPEEALGNEYDLALEELRLRGPQEFHVYVWVPRGLDPSASPHRDLLNRIGFEPPTGVEFMKTGFEELLDVLLAELRALSQGDLDRTTRLIYLIYGRQDWGEIEPLRRALGNLGFETREPAFTAEPSAAVKTHRAALAESDGVVVYWGTEPIEWVEANLSEVWLAKARGSVHTPLPVVVYLGPPSTPEKVKFDAPGFIAIHEEEPTGRGPMELASALSRGLAL